MPWGIQRDLTGLKFGRLTVLGYAGKVGNTYIALWKCRCECGREKLVRVTHLNNGNSTTCGCAHGVFISKPIQHHELLQLARYNAKTGHLVSRVTGRCFVAGKVLGGIDINSGYWQIVIGRIRYREHVLVWFYKTGEWPIQPVDHRNRDRADNRWVNLRLASPSQNNGNHPVRKDSASRLKGVHFYPNRKENPWRAMVKRRTIGYFATAKEAALAYDREARRVFRGFARTNFGTSNARLVEREAKGG